MSGNNFEFSEWYGDLTKELANKICICYQKAGWSRNPDTDHWECGNCKKPSRYCAIAYCASCDQPYYIENAIDLIYEPLCPKCSEGELNVTTDNRVKFGS